MSADSQIREINSLRRKVGRIEAERDALRTACELAIERIEHIGCKNCGTGGRPSPCVPCAEALAAINAALRESRT